MFIYQQAFSCSPNPFLPQRSTLHTSRKIYIHLKFFPAFQPPLLHFRFPSTLYTFLYLCIHANSWSKVRDHFHSPRMVWGFNYFFSSFIVSLFLYYSSMNPWPIVLRRLLYWRRFLPNFKQKQQKWAIRRPERRPLEVIFSSSEICLNK